jgi:hypothetical protein
MRGRCTGGGGVAADAEGVQAAGVRAEPAAGELRVDGEGAGPGRSGRTRHPPHHPTGTTGHPSGDLPHGGRVAASTLGDVQGQH